MTQDLSKRPSRLASLIAASILACVSNGAFAQDPSQGVADTTSTQVEHVHDSAEQVDIKDLKIPENSSAIYVIKPPMPSAEESAKLIGKKKAIQPPAEEKKPAIKRRTTPPMITWQNPDKPARCVLLCIHGLGLYNKSYEDFGKRMADSGIAVCAIDVRGFGSWMAAKGRESVDFDGCLADVKATLKVLHRVYPHLPIFLVGESMGGAIALRATSMYPELVSGLISSVPSGDRFQQKRTALRVAVHLLSSPDKPFNVGEGVVEQATEKQELRDAWLNDPLDRLNISARELLQFQGFMNQNHDSAKAIVDRPVLIVQGCKDHLVKPEGTVELYNELGTRDRQLILVPRSEHLIFEANQCPDDVLKVVTDWIDAHLTHKQAVGTHS
ncbi:MAG: lysophospholipase [Candidatus Obscuribacterales bacterium]|nr:lysophospholipase [Candidatus Obscuribacterales bacterium]